MYDTFDGFGDTRDEYDTNSNPTLSRTRRNPSRNALGAGVDDAQFGWMGRALTEMGNSRRHAISLNRNCAVIVTQGFPLQLMPNTPGWLLNAVKLATRGSAVKAIGRAIVANPVIDVTLNLGNVRSFGVHVRITDSVLNFKTGTFRIQLQEGATVINDIRVLPTRGQVDVIILGIANNGGMASVPGIDNPQVTFTAADGDYVASSTALFAETLNDRDLGVITNASGGLAT